MNHIGEYGPGRGSRSVTPPLLVECDRLGEVLWLSAAARLAFGAAHNLVGVIPPDSAVRLSVVLETRDSVLIGAQLGGPARKRASGGIVSNCLICGTTWCATVSVCRKRSGASPRARGRCVPEAVREPCSRSTWNGSVWGASLHTGVGQMLVAIRTQLEIVVAQLPGAASSGPGGARAHLHTAERRPGAGALGLPEAAPAGMAAPDTRRSTGAIVGDQRHFRALRSVAGSWAPAARALARSQGSDVPRRAGVAFQPDSAFARDAHPYGARGEGRIPGLARRG